MCANCMNRGITELHVSSNICCTKTVLMRNFCRKMARACENIYSIIVIEKGSKWHFFVHSCVATSKSVVMYDMHCLCVWRDQKCCDNILHVMLLSHKMNTHLLLRFRRATGQILCKAIIIQIYNDIIQICSGITSGRVLDGELLYTKILGVNLVAFAYTLFHEDLSPIAHSNRWIMI